MITIKVSYDTMLKRIEKRGRDYELVERDPSLVEYYQRLLRHYDIWMEEYDSSPLLIIDGDKYDFVGSVADRIAVLEQIEEKLYELNKISKEQLADLKKQHLELLNEVGW